MSSSSAPLPCCWPFEEAHSNKKEPSGAAHLNQHLFEQEGASYEQQSVAQEPSQHSYFYYCTTSSVVPLPQMHHLRVQPQSDPPLMGSSSSLRRRISDSSCSTISSSSSFEDDINEDEGDSEDDRHSSYQPCLNKAKRRRCGFRVGFEEQIVEKVHPCPYPPHRPDYDDTVDTTDATGSGGPTLLWYTHSELLAMKRVAKRTCARNHDLEYALNDAYHNCCPSSHRPHAKQAHQPQAVAAEAEHVDDSEPGIAPTIPLQCLKTDSKVSSTSDEPNIEAGHDTQLILLSIPAFRELRGMERWSSQRHALSRGLTMLQVKTEVFVLQAQHSSNQSSPTGLTPALLGTTPNSDIEVAARAHKQCEQKQQQQQNQGHALELARACSEASYPAARFARLMGQLDEVVARELHRDDDYNLDRPTS